MAYHEVKYGKPEGVKDTQMNSTMVLARKVAATKKPVLENIGKLTEAARKKDMYDPRLVVSEAFHNQF